MGLKRHPSGTPSQPVYFYFFPFKKLFRNFSQCLVAKLPFLSNSWPSVRVLSTTTAFSDINMIYVCRNASYLRLYGCSVNLSAFNQTLYEIPAGEFVIACTIPGFSIFSIHLNQIQSSHNKQLMWAMNWLAPWLCF